jgi:hypothetical protein
VATFATRAEAEELLKRFESGHWHAPPRHDLRSIRLWGRGELDALHRRGLSFHGTATVDCCWSATSTRDSGRRSAGRLSLTNHRNRPHVVRLARVAVVGDTVEISIGEHLIRSHPIRHDRTREHGALANPGGRPHRTNAA